MSRRLNRDQLSRPFHIYGKIPFIESFFRMLYRISLLFNHFRLPYNLRRPKVKSTKRMANETKWRGIHDYRDPKRD